MLQPHIELSSGLSSEVHFLFNFQLKPFQISYHYSDYCFYHTKTRPVRPVNYVRNAYRILVRKPEGKRPLGRPRCRWENNIRMDLRETGWGGMDWIDLAQDRDQLRALVNTIINLRVR
jgi:hypothetical protein